MGKVRIFLNLTNFRALESERPFLSVDEVLKKSEHYFFKCNKNDYFEGFSNFEYDNLEAYSTTVENKEIDNEYIKLYNDYFQKYGFRFVILVEGKDFETIKLKLRKRKDRGDIKAEFEKNVKELLKLMNYGIEASIQRGKIKVVGDYELRKTIGAGTFSKGIIFNKLVKYAINTTDNTEWAIKVIKMTKIKEEDYEENLKKEVSIMKLLDHKNVVKLKQVMKTEDKIYLVMEYIKGGELFDKIVEVEKFNEEDSRFYFQQLIKGMSYCHKNGVAHRDLKPENLLLDSKNVLKITDFGFSIKNEEEGKMNYTTCGKNKN
jgi:hypothetical protein